MVFGIGEIAVVLFLIGWLLQLLLGKGKLNMIFSVLFFIGAILFFIIYLRLGIALWWILWLIIAILAILSAFVGKK
jgi:hypothetical protein